MNVPALIDLSGQVREQKQFNIQLLADCYLWDLMWTDPYGRPKHSCYAVVIDTEFEPAAIVLHRGLAHKALNAVVNGLVQDKWMAENAYAAAGWVV